MRELSLNVMDVAENGISAGASRVDISVEETPGANLLVIRIEDNGCGMSPEQVAQVQNPFYTTRTTRRVGLGVPFFKMAAEMTGGSFFIDSEPGVGTKVRAVFNSGHIDMAPLGAMEETIMLMIATNPGLDVTYTRSRDSASFALDTRELREVLGEDVPLSSPEVTLWIKDYLAEGLASLGV